MAKFKYLGKKKDFTFSDAYDFKGVLNYGDEFEVVGQDLIKLKKCIEIAKAQGCTNIEFVLKDAYEMEQVIEEEEVVNIYHLKKIELEEMCKEQGIEFPKGSKRFDLINLIKGANSHV